MTASVWDAVVGIDVEDWMRADTTEQIAWLVWLRDNPMPPPPDCGCDRAEIYDFGGTLVGTLRGACRHRRVCR